MANLYLWRCNNFYWNIIFDLKKYSFFGWKRWRDALQSYSKPVCMNSRRLALSTASAALAYWEQRQQQPSKQGEQEILINLKQELRKNTDVVVYVIIILNGVIFTGDPKVINSKEAIESHWISQRKYNKFSFTKRSGMRGSLRLHS